MTDPRADLLAIFAAALEATGGRRVVRAALADEDLAAPVHVVAIGKAAAAMVRGARDVLGDSIARVLVITKRRHCQDLDSDRSRTELVEAGHPVPDAASLHAGDRLLAFLRQAPSDARLLFLVSGGASALVEVLPPGMDAEFLGRINRWLLGSGLPIDEINRVRGAVSMIKGGRLRGWLMGRPTLGLLLSDVPDDDPAVIGSGLLVAPEAATLPKLPGWMAEYVPSILSDRPWSGVRVRTRIVASRRDALAAAEAKARTLGYPVTVDERVLQGNALEQGRRLAGLLAAGPPGVRLWSGETTLALPARPGRGGRCQHLALAAAVELDGRDDALMLAAGTDGTDGPGEDAGALIDGRTVRRGGEEGLNALVALERADSGSFLAASGDLVHTGPTGTNVMDLVIGLRLGNGG